jgi:nucleotide-binding universal stress UspA family protein
MTISQKQKKYSIMTTYFNRKIERINCPFDFTRTGRVGLNYAGMLAAALGARLTIFYDEPSVWPDEPQLYEDPNESTKGIRRLLKLEGERLAERFGIECNYAIDPTTDSIELEVGSMSTDYDLIVMGTNGADNLYHHVFGVNTHHVLGLTRCPVLMVPLGYELQIPKKMVYAYDPETNPEFLIGQLERLAAPINASVDSVQVQAEGTREAELKIELLGEILGVKEQREFNWNFEPMYSDDKVLSVDQHIKETGADILALSYHHHTLFEKLFKENVDKRISRIADYPVLVFWH